MFKMDDGQKLIYDRSVGLPVNEEGIITSPGKFEGEPWWVPMFWNTALQGHYDEDDGVRYLFRLTKTDKDVYGLDCEEVQVWEDDNGFVRHECSKV